MKANMKKLTILGLPVTMFAAGLFAGAIMFGGSNSPTALKNVAHAQRPDDPVIQAFVVCVDVLNGTSSQLFGPVEPIPKGAVVGSLTANCPGIFNIATGGGHFIEPLDAKVRVTQSFRIAHSWKVTATR